MKYVENETVELKRSTSELKEAVVSIGAMLNKHSQGTVYFGINDGGSILGQPIGKSTLKDISKAISDLIERCEVYVKEHINWRADLSGSTRVEIPEVPVRAMKEAIINSLCHRDFYNPKSNEIAIYRDRIEIYNPGQFPFDHDPAEFIAGKGKSYPRNPLIAEAFYLTKDIERWGSGIRRIKEECDAAGVKVFFEMIPTGFQVTFFRPEGAVDEKAAGEAVQKTVVKSRVKSRVKILELMMQNPEITIPQIAEETDLSVKGVEKAIKILKEEGRLKRIGPDKGGHWEVLE